MPRLSQKLVKDVKRYVNLRFDHWSDDEKKERIRKTIKALKREPLDSQREYSKKVKNFFEINAGVLVDSFSHAKRQLDNEEVTRLLNIDPLLMRTLALKHGGNINAVLEELRANDNKSRTG